MNLSLKEKTIAYEEIKTACSRTIDSKNDIKKNIEILKKYFNPANPLLNINDPIPTKDNCDWTPLYYATYFNKIQEIETLLSLGADINICTSNTKNKVIHIAATNGKVAICKLFSKYGLDIDSANKRQQTPLMMSCEGDHFEVVEYLLENKANPNLRDENRETCLDYCKRNNNNTLLKFVQYHNLKNNLDFKNTTVKSNKGKI